MIKTGRLKRSGGSSLLDEPPLITLAVSGASDPRVEATNFLANSGLSTNQFIRVEGSNGFVGSDPVFFITAASPLSALRSKAKKAGGKSTKKSAKKSSKKSAAKRGGAKKSAGGRASAGKSTSKKSGNKSRRRS